MPAPTLFALESPFGLAQASNDSGRLLLTLLMCVFVGQNVCDEFVCALRKRILLQGRLYICEHYICFYSHLFGYMKEKVIPLKVPASQPPCHSFSCSQHQHQSRKGHRLLYATNVHRKTCPTCCSCGTCHCRMLH